MRSLRRCTTTCRRHTVWSGARRSLRKLGIKITFDRQGHGGTRTITIVQKKSVSGVSGVSDHGDVDLLADGADSTDNKSSAKYNGTSESNQQEREVFTI